MGRYLPWRDDPADSSRPRKRLKGGLGADDLGAKKNDNKEVLFRDDEYMRDGIQNDDRYIMVEDELLQIAKSYTAKLHSAELARLQAQIALKKAQKLAASQPSSSQPRITGSISKQRQVVLQRRAHDAAIRKAAGIQNQDADEEQSYNHKFSSQSLGRLMSTSAARLDSSLPLPLNPGKLIKPATRAAAGFTKASFKKLSSSQTTPSQLRSSQIIQEVYNNGDGAGSECEDDEDLDFVPRRSSSILMQPKMITIGRPKSSHTSDRRISLAKHPPTSASAQHSKLLSSPHSFKKPSLLSSSPPSRPSRTSTFSGAPLVSGNFPKSASEQDPPIVDSDSDNDYANAEQAARWRRRSLPKPSTSSFSALNPKRTPVPSSSKPKHIVVDTDDEDEDDDYADAEQAARWRKRKQFSEAQRSGAKS